MKMLRTIILFLIAFAVFACNPQTGKEEAPVEVAGQIETTEAEWTVHFTEKMVMCGNSLPEMALGEQIPYFQDQHIITFGFENYHPAVSKYLQIECVDTLFSQWVNPTGRKVKLIDNVECADIQISFIDDTGPALAYVERYLGYPQCKMVFNRNVNFFYANADGYREFKTVVDHEFLHALGQSGHIDGCSCIAEPYIDSIPIDYEIDIDLFVYSLGYCAMKMELLCQLN